MLGARPDGASGACVRLVPCIKPLVGTDVQGLRVGLSRIVAVPILSSPPGCFVPSSVRPGPAPLALVLPCRLWTP